VPGAEPFQYAIVHVVPRVERGERFNGKEPRNGGDSGPGSGEPQELPPAKIAFTSLTHLYSSRPSALTPSFS